MRTFAAMTGGRAYFPRFQAEFPEIFRDIGDDIRNQYTLAYSPTNNEARWHLPQTESAGRCARWRSAESERPEGQET